MKIQILFAFLVAACLIIPGTLAATQCYYCATRSDISGSAHATCSDGDTSNIPIANCGADMWCAKAVGVAGGADVVVRACSDVEMTPAVCQGMSAGYSKLDCYSCTDNLCNSAISIKGTSMIMGVVLSSLLVIKNIVN